MRTVRHPQLRPLWLALGLAACGGGDTGGADQSNADAAIGDSESAPEEVTGDPDALALPDAGAELGPDALGGSDLDASADTPGQPGDRCDTDRDCLTGYCVDLVAGEDSGTCVEPCADDSDCPRESDCLLLRGTGADATRVCIPSSICIDGDGDGYGIGPGCAGTDCNDDDSLVNPGADESCNGEDDDCDRVVDDNPIGVREACATGFPGICSEGSTACINALMQCVPDSEPADERCNGEDDDCDGEIDRVGGGAALTRACYDADASTLDVGICHAGAESCVDGDWTGCIGQVLPATGEACDGLDNDCDGDVDEGAGLREFFPDRDGDGRGDGTATAVAACVAPDGHAESGDDCDDEDRSVFPGALEIPGDGRDSDCDGTEVCHEDLDGDGFRSGRTLLSADLDCDDLGESPDAAAGDCNDADDAVHPGASEIPGDEIDTDCDGGELCWADADNDGARTDDVVESPNLSCSNSGEAQDFEPAGDCDDSNPSRRPGVPDTCDGVDSDCDGLPDDDASPAPWWPDSDEDGFGDAGASEVQTCAAPAGFVSNALDCDDLDPDVRPTASDAPADGVDANCDETELCFADLDEDGFRTAELRESAWIACDGPGDAPAFLSDGDCDDTDALVHPGADEVAGDDIDEDCDGGEICYRDADNDGWRLDTTLVSPDANCLGAGEARADAFPGDCDDAQSDFHPGAAELCDGFDNDCDGDVDEDVSSQTFYRDADGDGFGRADLAEDGCARPEGFAVLSGDCNDSDDAAFPGAFDAPGDGIDRDCDGSEICFVDEDGDGWRTGFLLLSTDPLCDAPGEAWASAPDGDCDDTASAVNPGADEAPGDETDADCDGTELCFRDGDDDGWRTDVTIASVDRSCDDYGEARLTAPGGDCDDAVPTTHPGAPESLDDGADSDCDGAELCFVDADGDGWRPDSTSTTLSSGDLDCLDVPEGRATDLPGDCDDADAEAHPGAAELCGDGGDDDCDASVDCRDADCVANEACEPAFNWDWEDWSRSDPPLGFTESNGGALSTIRETADVCEGSSSGRISWSDGGAHRIESATLSPANPAWEYTVHTWLFDSDSAGRGAPGLLFTDAAGATLGSSYSSAWSVDGASWVEHTWRVTPPAGTARLVAALAIQGVGGPAEAHLLTDAWALTLWVDFSATDGVTDAIARSVATRAGAGDLFAGINNAGRLYVATQRSVAGTGDRFLFVWLGGASTGALVSPPWAKAGQVAAPRTGGTLVALAQEESNAWCEWRRYNGATWDLVGAEANCNRWDTDGPMVEGWIDLVPLLGVANASFVPSEVTLAGAMFGPFDGSALLAGSQVPATVSDDGRVDGSETTSVHRSRLLVGRVE